MGSILSTPTSNVHERLKTNGTAIKAPSTRIRRFSYPQIFLCGYTQRPHVSAVYARCIRRFLYTLSRVEISVYAVYPDTCGRSYPYIFVYADVTVSEPVFFRARFSKMAASRNVVCSMLLGLLSSLIACLELNVAMLNLNFKVRVK